MILQRIRQFIRAMRAKITPDDIALIENHLTIEARPLFFAMAVIDQCHAVSVARTAMKIASQRKSCDVDDGLLARCALLHDVGRRNGDMGPMGGVWGKTLTVLLGAAFPDWSRRRAKSGKGDIISRWLFVYYHHASIGADMLETIGLAREADIIRRHHDIGSDGDEAELKILREADGLN